MSRSLILRVLAALALIGVAVVHLAIAGDYSGFGKHPLSIHDQFLAQAVIALLLAAALLIKPHFLVWLATAGFAVGSLAVLVYTRYKVMPVYGFPQGFGGEGWDARGAKLAAGFEAGALLVATIGAGLTMTSFANSVRQARSS